MEILTIILEACATVGFPIAIAVAMAVFIYKIYKASEVREEKLMKELAVSHETNAQAIQTIAKFAGNIDTIQSDISEIKTDITILTAKVEGK